MHKNWPIRHNQTNEAVKLFSRCATHWKVPKFLCQFLSVHWKTPNYLSFIVISLISKFRNLLISRLKRIRLPKIAKIQVQLIAYLDIMASFSFRSFLALLKYLKKSFRNMFYVACMIVCKNTVITNITETLSWALWRIISFHEVGEGNVLDPR